MRIARSGFSWFLSAVGGVAISWIASLYFTRALTNPNATLGQFYLFESILSFAMLISSGGLKNALTIHVSRSQDENEKAEYVGAGILLSAILVFSATVLVFIASPFIMAQFGFGGLSVLFIVGSIWAVQVRDTATSLISAYGSHGRSGWIGSFDTSSRAGAQGILVYFGYGLFGLMAGTVIGASLAAIVSITVLSTGIRLPSREQIEDILHFSKYSFVSAMATKFYDNIDIILINTFVGAAATGIYGIGFRFSLVLKIFAGAVSKTSGIELSRHSAAGDQDRVREILTDATVFATVLSIPAFVGMIIIGDQLIKTIYTDSFSDAAIIATLAVGIQIPDGFRSVFSSVLHGLDRPDITYRSGLIIIISNLSLNILFVPTMGALGAIIASFISVTAAMVYLFINLFELLNLSATDFPHKPVLHEMFAAIMMGIILILVDQSANLNVVPSLIMSISIGIVTYFVILFIISVPVRGRLLGIIEDIVPSIGD